MLTRHLIVLGLMLTTLSFGAARAQAAVTPSAVVGEAATTASPVVVPVAVPVAPTPLDDGAYAAREAKAKGLEAFKGGDVVIIGSTTVVVVLLVVLILVII